MRRITKKKVLRVAMMLLLAVMCTTVGAQTRIAVASDIHVMAPSLLPSGAETQDAWITYYAGQRKMLQESAAIFDQFVTTLKTANPKPDLLLVTGDLTKDGEQASHEYVRKELALLEAAGIQVYVIPGNHDFGEEGNHTQFLADGTTTDAPVLSVGSFASFYANYGYTGSTVDPNGSLSYVAEPVAGLVLLAIDSHSASVSSETLTWICGQAEAARAGGKQVIAMMHHPLFPHIEGANLFISTYTVGDYETVRNALIAAGVNVILSGHFHTSDIAKDWNDDEGKAVYDINTGSLISYPCDYRTLTLSQDKKSLNVSTESLLPKGMTSEECKTWLQSRMKSVATQKMNEKARALASMYATQINNIADFASGLFILHAEGNENASAGRATLASTYGDFKGDATYGALLTAGGITDASIYSILDDKSNYGNEHENKTDDRTLAVSMPLASNQVVIGEPTATYGHMLPVGAANKYVLTQQVYTTSEFSHAAGKIWGLGFNTVKGNLSRHLSIYVTHTTNTSVGSYTPVTENDLCFSGDVFFKAGQWNAIDFTKPFEYDGTSNLLITICDDTGTKGDYNALTNRFYNPGSSQTIYATNDEQAYNAMDANEGTDFNSISSWKAQIQLAFTAHPVPSGMAVADVTDQAATVSCTLRGGATAWNLRYHQMGDGEWSTVSNIAEAKTTLDGLSAATQYEIQVQGVFAGDALSSWSTPATFVTSCCPPEDMCELLYSMNVKNPNAAAIQIVDAETGIEVGSIQMNQEGVSGGYFSLCNGRQYNVNFLQNTAGWYQTSQCSVSLFLTPGDEIYTMSFNGSPEEDGLLTSFVMECGSYCAPRPRFLTAYDVTCQSATLTYQATTTKEEIQYSTDPAFPDDKTTTIEVTRTAPEDESTYQLTGLEPLTIYYIRVRSVCPDEDPTDEIGDQFSRWTPAVRFITDSKFARTSRVQADPVDSKTEHTAWKRRGMEGMTNVNYRAHGEGTPASAEAILMVDLDGDGQSFDSWGSTSYASYGGKNTDNVIGIANVPANSMVSWKAANAKTGSNTAVRFQYGFIKQTKKYGDDEAEIAAAQAALAAAIAEKKQQEEEEEEQLEEEAAAQGEEPIAKLLEEAQDIETELLTKTVVLNGMADDDPGKPALNALCALLDAQLDDLRQRINELNEKDAAAQAAQAALANAQAEKEANEARSMRAPHRTGEEDVYYFFYIRHTTDDQLLVQDITLTPPENIGNWITIPNVTNVEYTLKNLQPGKEYEVMVQPVYESGFVGIASPITVFSTIGTESDPMESEFSVSTTKKVQFSKGNLRYNGDEYEGHWTMAPEQYDMLGEDNVDVRSYGSYPANLHDLLCWSITTNHYGTSYYTYNDDEDAAKKFIGDFADWGTSPELIRDLGAGWTTLSKNEWDYLINTRENAATLRAFATVNNVKGLILLPDDWTEATPAGTFTAEEWATLEAAGAVFLPAAGQLSFTYTNSKDVTTYTEGGKYWTSTPSDDESGMNAMVLSFTDTDITTDEDQFRRVGAAVRLVKVVEDVVTLTLNEEEDLSAVLVANNGKLANVTLMRTLQAGSYNTFAVPFEIDYTTLNDMGLTVKRMTASEYNESTKQLSITFVDASTIEAGKPYLVKVAASVENPTFSSVTVSATAVPTKTDALDFIPTMGKTTITGSEAQSVIFLGAGNTLYNPSALPADMKGFRAYFQLKGEGAHVRAFSMDFGDGEATGIITPGAGGRPADDAVYTIDGRRIGKPAQKGVYIQNGKKYVVK